MARRLREGPGRLSGIELLPPEAQDIVAWAYQQLAARNRTQLDIYAEFRTKLIALQGEQGLAFNIPSFSAFNRVAVEKAVAARAMEQVRITTTALAGQFRGTANEDLMVMLIESQKTLAWNAASYYLSGGGQMKTKELLEMARATQALIMSSIKSEEQRQRYESQKEAAEDDIVERASVAAREAGVSADRIAQMRHDFLGVRAKVKAEADTSRLPTAGAP